MIHFIQLTGVSGKSVWVNMAQIVAIVQYPDHTFLCESTRNRGGDGHYFGIKVKDSPAQIAKLMPQGSISVDDR